MIPVFRRGGGGGPVRGSYRDGLLLVRLKPVDADSGDGGGRWRPCSVGTSGCSAAPSCARLWDNQVGEVMLRAVVHNLMLLAA